MNLDPTRPTPCKWKFDDIDRQPAYGEDGRQSRHNWFLADMFVNRHIGSARANSRKMWGALVELRLVRLPTGRPSRARANANRRTR